MIRIRPARRRLLSGLGCGWLLLAVALVVLPLAGAASWPAVLLLLVPLALATVPLALAARVRVELSTAGVTVYSPARRHVPWADIARVTVRSDDRVALALTSGKEVRTPLRRTSNASGFQSDLAILRHWHERYLAGALPGTIF